MEAANKFSPKEFLRKRRPEKFSDSIVEETGTLDRAFLEYYLSSLNNRSQELQFESFSKAVCEKVICSNLLEQTGPVAGGDGKTDTQTFPVSEQNRLMWYEGVNESSHKERWAFGVSTRKDWKAKCKEDVKKIAGTNRGYVKAFNVTNQFVKSDQRSDLEDKLSKEFDLDVRILDRSWLLDQVFKNNLQDIAIETLSIPVSYERNVTLGAGDYRKDVELESLNKKISTEVEPKNITLEQVNWFLRVAELSTELEKPELECRGLYDRAINVAEKFGSNQQRLNAYYGYAWKAHFWLEDIELVEQNLVKSIDCISDSESSTKWEKVVTLLNVYRGHIKITGFDGNVSIDEINETVLTKLKEIASDDTKPSNALLAETHIEMLKLQQMNSVSDTAPIFASLKKIVEKSEHLVGYPFEQVFATFNEMDDFFHEVVEYEDLMDYLIESTSKRDGEVQGAIKYLKRGFKRLETGKPLQAITLIGKALSGLYKEESSEAVILGLRAISSAYESVGLLWAARASALFASSLLIDDFWKHDFLNEKQVESFIRLCWIELRLGRLGQSLQWYELSLVVQSRLGESLISENETTRIDAYISHLLLNERLESLKTLECIPQSLIRLGLLNSSGFLQFALGYDQDLKEVFKDKNEKELLDYLVLVRDYDFGISKANLEDISVRRGEIETNVLGCKIFISYPMRTPYLELSESILSIVESFFATGHLNNLHAKESKLEIEIIADDEDELSVSHEIDDSGGLLRVIVTCSSFEVETINKNAQLALHNWGSQFLIDILCRIFYVNDPKSFAKELIADDKGMERSVSFASSFAATYNVIGKEALKDAQKFFNCESSDKFVLKRELDWDKDYPKTKLETEESNQLKRGTTDIPIELMEPEKMKHGDFTVQSLIKPRLWDKAKWKGVGFSLYPDGTTGIDLIFSDEGAGDQVFQDLIDEVGIENRQSRLQVNILKGVSTKEPNNYRVQICENFDASSLSKQTTMISRLNTMTPASGDNLRNFVSALEKKKSCRLSYGTIDKGKMYKPANSINSYIKLDSLNIINAWEVEINSMESAAIQLEDAPVIPKEVDNAPVLKVIEQRRKVQ
ncbi:hypothetical protein [uncultured Pseudoalteromonas sp.]|uniref:hypothetical protein n=1 Tax=uncultured Pseudoalteromonas sp. TaxID=114053 RepID=UPI002596297F|nr:hypothetical protein [uncultured Pseudoalteromonas sp.]